MITRRNIIVLAVVTAICLLVAGLIGQDDHGTVTGPVGDVAWFAFLLGALLLVVIGVSRLARWFRLRARAVSAR
jgi:hypothetical protein